MQCSRCGREISQEQSYVNQGRVFCEDCLMDIGLSIKECDPWAAYVDNRTRERSSLEGTEGLTDIEKEVYEFVKSKGRATRAEVMEALKLSEIDLKSQLVPLMHADLIKEHSEAGTMYLIIPANKQSG